jgi:hypothetical protein
VGSFPGMWYLVPQPFAARGNRSYPEFLGRNWRPVVPEVNYPNNAAVYLRCYNVGCLKMFISDKLDVLVLDVINLQCCFFSSRMLMKIA